MVATVNNIFSNTNLTEDNVEEVLQEVIKNNPNITNVLGDVTFNRKYCLHTIQVLTHMSQRLRCFKKRSFYTVSVLGEDLCQQQPFPCEEISTNCSSTQGRADCTCKEGFISYSYSDTSCRGKLCYHVQNMYVLSVTSTNHLRVQVQFSQLLVRRDLRQFQMVVS